MKEKIIFFLFLTSFIEVNAQIIFQENFGESIIRLTSSTMPTGSFTFGNPTGTTVQKAIENDHYAVVDPTHIADGYPIPFYWFWTGSQPSGNTSGSTGSPATLDHTVGDTNGAVLVVNGGTTLSYFYDKPVHLQAGNCYRISYWLYVVNPTATIAVDLRDVTSHTLLQNYNSGTINSTSSWVQYSYDFKLPLSCSSSDLTVSIRNALSSNSGNDFYVDDIMLEQLTTCLAPEISNCPTEYLSTIQNNFEEFGITPNPSNGIFNVKLSTNEKVSISVYDMGGRSVFNKLFNNQETIFNEQLNLNTLTSGIYFIAVESGDKKEIKKIIIE